MKHASESAVAQAIDVESFRALTAWRKSLSIRQVRETLFCIHLYMHARHFTSSPDVHQDRHINENQEDVRQDHRGYEDIRIIKQTNQIRNLSKSQEENAV